MRGGVRLCVLRRVIVEELTAGETTLTLPVCGVDTGIWVEP